MATVAEVKQTLEDYAWLLEKSPKLAGLDDKGIALIASLFNDPEAEVRLKRILAGSSTGFAAFLRDAENRTLLINLIARWL